MILFIVIVCILLYFVISFAFYNYFSKKQIKKYKYISSENEFYQWVCFLWPMYIIFKICYIPFDIYEWIDNKNFKKFSEKEKEKLGN